MVTALPPPIDNELREPVAFPLRFGEFKVALLSIGASDITRVDNHQRKEARAAVRGRV
jgi:hypothetical protein